jgi:colanic acid/amylovoran biosynthesis glycosyltransferase
MYNQSSLPPKLCLAVPGYPCGVAVNRHLQELFGGNSVVVCETLSGIPDNPDRVFALSQKDGSVFRRLQAPYHHIRNHLAYSTFRVPYGHQKQKLLRFLSDQRVDAILAEFGNQAVGIWPVAQELGLPMFTYFRGQDASRRLRRAIRVTAYRRMMPHLAGVFSVSQFLLDQLAQHDLTHWNAHVVPSGVDTRRFGAGEKQTGLILAVGRFTEKKAPLITLESFLDVAAKHAEARLEFIGGGKLLRACQDRAGRSDHADRIVFHGARPHDFVRKRLAAADIFIQHSVTARNGDTEGLPTSIQEAMASGAAVLSTRHAGIGEAVRDNETGFLVEEFDRDAFTNRLDLLLGDQALCRKLGTAAREYAEANLDYRALYGTVERVIAEAVRNAPRVI